MATNVPAVNFDIVRIAINSTGETSVVIPAHTLRLIYMQCPTANDVYITKNPGGTWSLDNFYTIKSGQAVVLEDIALLPLDSVAGGGTFWYARGSVDDIYLEVLYAEG